MSNFDPTAFLDAQVTEVNERRPPLPTENPASQDGLYTAVLGEPTTKSGSKEDGSAWLSVVVPITVEVPPQVQDGLGIKLEKGTLTITDRAFIDMTAAGGIDNSPGKNRRQKMYRDALDLNKPGDTWSWRMITGRPVKVKVSHRMYEGQPQEEITQILPPA